MMPFLSLEAIFASSKALGMAATGVALPQDAFATAYNPAGLAEIEQRIDLSLNYFHQSGKGKISNNLNPLFNGDFNGTHTHHVWDPESAVNVVLPNCMRLGLAVYNSNYLKTTYRPALNILGQGKQSGLEYVQETIAFTAAMPIHRCHSIGVSFNYMIQRIKIDGLQNSDVPFITAYLGHVTNRGYNYSSGLGVTFGWIGHLTDYLTVGIAYQVETKMGRFHKYKGFIADRGSFNIPQMWKAGIALKPDWHWVLTFDFEYIPWKDIRTLKNPLIPNVINFLAGTKKGPGFGWNNQTFYRAGIAYRWNPYWTYRIGYRYTRSPIRESNAFGNLITLNCFEQLASVGATWSWNCYQELSLFYLYAFENKIKGRDSIPPAFGGGNVLLKNHAQLMGVTFGYRF